LVRFVIEDKNGGAKRDRKETHSRERIEAKRTRLCGSRNSLLTLIEERNNQQLRRMKKGDQLHSKASEKKAEEQAENLLERDMKEEKERPGFGTDRNEGYTKPLTRRVPLNGNQGKNYQDPERKGRLVQIRNGRISFYKITRKKINDRNLGRGGEWEADSCLKRRNSPEGGTEEPSANREKKV